jgi:hypothetical protein
MVCLERGSTGVADDGDFTVATPSRTGVPFEALPWLGEAPSRIVMSGFQSSVGCSVWIEDGRLLRFRERDGRSPFAPLTFIDSGGEGVVGGVENTSLLLSVAEGIMLLIKRRRWKGGRPQAV